MDANPEGPTSHSAEAGSMKRMMVWLAGWTGISALREDLMASQRVDGRDDRLMAMSIQSVRLQTGIGICRRHRPRRDQCRAGQRPDLRIVMESRGIYSPRRARVKQYADELLKRNREWPA